MTRAALHEEPGVAVYFALDGKQIALACDRFSRIEENMQSVVQTLDTLRQLERQGGKPAAVDITLARPTHTLTVTSTPSGATVSISGRPAGTTPTAVKIMGFTGIAITVEKKGFKPVTEKLYSKVESDRLAVKLVRGK